MKMLYSFMVCLVLTLFVGIAIRASDKKPEKTTDPAFAQFLRNAKAYVELRQKIEKTLPSLEDKEDAEEIRSHKQTLRLKLAAARNGAIEGSMFTPQAAVVLRRILNAEMRGPEGKTARTTVLESSPKAFECKINGAYPATEPVSTVPPDLLMKLPELPDNLEYRFVQSTLILRDAKANMIIDCLRKAAPLPAAEKAKASSAENKTDQKPDNKAEKKSE